MKACAVFSWIGSRPNLCHLLDFHASIKPETKRFKFVNKQFTKCGIILRVRLHPTNGKACLFARIYLKYTNKIN